MKPGLRFLVIPFSRLAMSVQLIKCRINISASHLLSQLFHQFSICCIYFLALLTTSLLSILQLTIELEIKAWELYSIQLLGRLKIDFLQTCNTLNFHINLVEHLSETVIANDLPDFRDLIIQSQLLIKVMCQITFRLYYLVFITNDGLLKLRLKCFQFIFVDAFEKPVKTLWV